MAHLLYPLDLFRFTLERLWQHRTLVSLTLVGLTAAAALAMSLLLYVDAVNAGLLQSHLTDPPFAFRYRYLGVWNGTISREAFETASRYTRDSFTATIGLPTARLTEYTGGGVWSFTTEGYALGGFTLASLTGADDLIEITSGELPSSDASGDEIPVMLHESVFERLGVQVGDTITAQKAGGGTVTLRVAALWRPVNADDSAWLFPPRFFEAVALLSADTLWSVIGSAERPVEEAAWGIIFDGSDVKTADVSSLISRIQMGERAAGDSLNGIRLELSPVEGLRSFNVEVERLTVQLAIVSLPVGGLTLYFVTLVAGLLVGRQTHDDSVLSSRGMSRRAILIVHAFMWVGLACAAFAIALAVSPSVVEIVGRTSSFLRFDNTDTALRSDYTTRTLVVGIFTALLAAAFGMALSWRSSRQGVVGSTARASKAWWQRVYLDVLLFIPALYALYSLSRSTTSTGAVDPFSDPLTLGAPTLFSLSLVMLFLRLYPFVLRIWGGIVNRTRSIPLMMALRELTRSIGRYRGLLLMMGFTLSLTGFTASMASTLDRSLKDTIDYQIGADLTLVPATDAETESETDSSGQQTGVTVTGFNTLPAEDLAAIDGVEAVSRVGKYTAQIILPTERPAGTIVGIDRAGIAAVIRGRSDYSDIPFADLFNRLAVERTGIILNAQFARDHQIAINSAVTVQINALNAWWEITVPVIGTVEYFPTLDPRQNFFGLMSLDVVFETVGSELPHDLWLSLSPDADMETIYQEVAALGYPIIQWRDPDSALRAALNAPLRQGVLGFLSVGFVAAVVLTLLGAVTQNAATFRSQAVQLGVLRAMGLSGLAASAYLLLVQILAAVGGVAGGTGIGILTTLLYLPLLDFSSGLPPYLIRVAWSDIALVYAVFGGVLLGVILLTTVIMSRQSLTTLVKLGDT